MKSKLKIMLLVVSVNMALFAAERLVFNITISPIYNAIFTAFILIHLKLIGKNK